jgi:hypothetical protein
MRSARGQRQQARPVPVQHPARAQPLELGRELAAQRAAVAAVAPVLELEPPRSRATPRARSMRSLPVSSFLVFPQFNRSRRGKVGAWRMTGGRPPSFLSSFARVMKIDEW